MTGTPIRTGDVARRLAELFDKLERGDQDRPPAVVILRTLLRYVGEHGSTCAAAKGLAAAFDNGLESGSIRLAGPEGDA